MLQVLSGLVVAMAFLVFNLLACPFADFRVNWLRTLADLQLCVTLAACLALKVRLGRVAALCCRASASYRVC